ncbi:MAG TPA: type IX secretion system sortase PorU [Bacteroidota bacterium]|nr:type IX secretion system sortase PorU [Bacteroidota bacterium]
MIKGIVDRLWRKASLAAKFFPLLATGFASAQPAEEWFRLEVSETGIYKIDQTFFTRANFTGSVGSFANVQIFGRDGTALREDPAQAGPFGLAEIQRLVVDRNNNGTFDADDYVLFYGRSPRWWRYNTSTRTFNHYLNYYTEVNHYFVKIGGSQTGRTMQSIPSASPAGAYPVADVQGKAFLEEELVKLGTNSGREWLGRFFNRTSNAAVFTTLLPGLDNTRPVTYRFVLVTRSATVDTFRIEENGASPAQQLGPPVLMFPIDVTSIETDYAYKSPVVSHTTTVNFTQNRSVLRLTFSTRNDAAEGWLDWFEILYRQKLEATNDQFIFHTPDTSAVLAFSISGFTVGEKLVFDATDHSDVKRITGVSEGATNPGLITFQIDQTTGPTVREIVAVGPTGFKVPGNVRRISNPNANPPTPAEFVIITPTEFTAEAQRLKGHRERVNPLTTTVVNLGYIFDIYGSGIGDPTAVRNFLIDARLRWGGKPNYVLLFGDGHFDYKNIRTTVRNWIPPYETVNSIQQIQTYTTDDYFALLTPGSPRVTVRIGRLPIRSAEEARVVVDKIICYETGAPFDTWRSRITFVADDGLTSTRDDGNIHTYQADQLATSYTPATFDKRKIYIVEYPTVSGSLGRRKPDANKAIIDAVNRGTLILNYTGHGNPRVWAHEQVFTKDASLPQLKNFDRLHLLVAATCDFARFDHPDEHSAGEEMLTMGQGGAIAVMTAARAVYSFENAEFNNRFFFHLFQRDSAGRPVRLGDAMYFTKQVLFLTNDLKFHLFADPTVTLAMPRATVAIDSVNGSAPTSVVSVPALGRVSLEGSLRQMDGSSWPTFTGRALLEVYDSKRRILVPEWGTFSYEVNGSLLYRGEISVVNGVYNTVFPIPKDVSYDNNRARIAVYAWNDSLDAIGQTENIVIAGTDTLAQPDSVGPSIQVFLDDYQFRPGDVVKPDAVLIVDLTDESGINTSVAGVGHRLEARIENLNRTFDLSEFYRSNLDTYQGGQVRYPISGLPEGRHTMLVKAWDIHNNSASVETFFEVRVGSALSLVNVMNIPNPFSRTTMFTFQRPSTEPIEVEVKIYTLSGRLIQILQSGNSTDRFVQIPWDGRDRDGNEIANGVYFYKVIAKSLLEGRSAEAIGKLAVVR